LTTYKSHMFPNNNVPLGDLVILLLSIESNLQNPFGSVNRHFQAKHAKYLNFCTIEITAAISTKFFTVIKTSKYSLWVVPQIQDGGRPHLENTINCYISSTVWPNFHQICKVTQIGPLIHKNHCNIQNFKNPKWQIVTILKIINAIFPNKIERF